MVVRIYSISVVKTVAMFDNREDANEFLTRTLREGTCTFAQLTTKKNSTTPYEVTFKTEVYTSS
jgi:hypothetical protein